MLATDKNFFTGIFILATMGIVVFNAYDPERQEALHLKYCMELKPSEKAEDARDFKENGCAEVLKKRQEHIAALQPRPFV